MFSKKIDKHQNMLNKPNDKRLAMECESFCTLYVANRENYYYFSHFLPRWKKTSKMPPTPGRRGTRKKTQPEEGDKKESRCAGKSTAAEDPAPRFNGMPQRRGTTRSNGESKPTAAGDVALLLGEVLGKNRRIRGFHLPSCCYIVHYQFLGVAEGVVEYAVLLGFACSTGDEQL